MADGPQKTAHPRYATARSTLFVDRVMTWLIRAGGLGIILAVSGIFVFILWQILPLFRSARVEADAIVALPVGDYVALGMDEWGEQPFALARTGEVVVTGLVAGSEPRVVPSGLRHAAAAASYHPLTGQVVVGSDDGRLSLVTITYPASFVDGARTVGFSVASDEPTPIGQAGARIIAVDYAGDANLAAVIQEGQDGRRGVHVATRGGDADAALAQDLTPLIHGTPQHILLDERGDSVVVATSAGDLFYFFRSGDTFALRQDAFRPFADLPDQRIASLDFLLGDVSLVLTSPSGANRVLTLCHKDGGHVRVWAMAHHLPPLPAGADCYAKSVRNKAFFVGAGDTASLRFATLETVRWERRLEYPIVLAAINAKYDRLVLLDPQGRLHGFALNDPHPEAGLRGYFGEVWYEGASAPKYEWQSSGGSDDNEPKLSLVNLVFGTLKGTFYAVLFAIPIALLGALYTAEFLNPRLKSWIKPTIEIMASLPSVVLGFLAAQWLAPAIEARVPSLLIAILAVPAAAMLFGALWARLPVSQRALVRPGYEFIAFAPLLILVAWGAWQLGPLLEQLLFAGDFRQWWPRVMGVPFEQRNSLVVGFMMGFAIIPIIFTIAEDSLSNVPRSMRSGALALGASRWQVAFQVVLPTASAGIFSAVMIGLGRAIGETMIVVMATGNTPIMDWNIFSGMRTLSANIAQELPEAAEGGTLYRTLFLGAMLLFLMTFAINTLAELMRQHLREKYKTV